MSTPWKSYLHLVRPHIPGLAVLNAVQAIREAAIEFCRRSKIWKYDLDAIDVVALTSEYALTAPAGTDSAISGPTTVRMTGRTSPLNPISEDELDDGRPGWVDTQSNVATHFFIKPPHTLRLFPTPKTGITGGLQVQVALKPGRSVSQGPDWLYEDWSDVIAYGAIYRLKTNSGKIWENNPMADYEFFKEGVARATVAANKSGTTRSLRVKRRRFI